MARQAGANSRTRRADDRDRRLAGPAEGFGGATVINWGGDDVAQGAGLGHVEGERAATLAVQVEAAIAAKVDVARDPRVVWP